MSRFAHTATTARPAGPLRTLGDVRPQTYNGGAGFALDARSELFTLAVTNFVGQDTYYETAANRDRRFVDLVREAAVLDPEWFKQFVPWLRHDAYMRTASVIAAVEGAHVWVQNKIPGGKDLIGSTLARADEPAEALAYWMSVHGRTIPAPIKRGIALALVRLYNERAALKYDSREHRMRMFDVIELCHPKARAPWQHKLFTYLGDKRHQRANPRFLDDLATIRGNREMHVAAAAGEEITELADGGTWEALSAHGPMDASKWEMAIPQMRVHALLKNLRNIENAGVSLEAMRAVEAKLSDPAEIAAAKVFPFEVWRAWKNSGTMRFGPALELALQASLANVPDFPGRTLAMIDVSDSMNNPLAGRPPKGSRSRIPASEPISRKQAAILFGVAVMNHSASGSQLGVFGTTVAAMQDQRRSVLRHMDDITTAFTGQRSPVGHGTNTWPCTKHMWDSYGPFNRIVIFTDGQSNPSFWNANAFPKDVPIFVWDLAGYGVSTIDTGSNRYMLAGLTDQSFKTMRLLEQARAGRWPWEA